jgi:[ribosomal protein S5]-alanine N-acetyltransferase
MSQARERRMIAELKTQRLTLRPLQLSDAEQMQEIFPQWEIVKFLSAKVSWPYPAGRAFENYRDRVLPAIDRGEEWHWTLRLHQSPARHIGVISLYKDEWNNRG